MAKPDQLTYPTASALRDCLADQAVDSTFGPVASKVVRFGAANGATMDGCDCESVDGNGRAGVRVAGLVPVNLFARGDRNAAGVRTRRCGNAWAVTYELSLVRCYPMSSDGSPLPATEVDQIAQKYLSDQAAIMRAIDCCEYLERHSGVELVNVGPIGPTGGCAGNQATIRVVQAHG